MVIVGTHLRQLMADIHLPAPAATAHHLRLPTPIPPAHHLLVLIVETHLMVEIHLLVLMVGIHVLVEIRLLVLMVETHLRWLMAGIRIVLSILELWRLGLKDWP